MSSKIYGFIIGGELHETGFSERGAKIAASNYQFKYGLDYPLQVGYRSYITILTTN